MVKKTEGIGSSFRGAGSFYGFGEVWWLKSNFNPNKVGVFDGSFFWARGGQFYPTPLFIFQEKLM